MALSPQYSWPEPDNSSLVKNGAQDIRALGDAIDTSVWNVGYGQAGKNKIINGNFGIWQRGTSFSNPANEAYTSDRFNINYDGTGATRTISQQAFTPGTAPVAGYEGQFFYRYARTVAGSGANFDIVRQPIEDVRTFAGQPVNISFYAKSDSGTPVITLALQQVFGSGGSAAVRTDIGTATLSTSWTRYSVTGTVPSISGKTLGANNLVNLQIRTPVNTIQTFDFWGVQVEYGSKATPFQTATGTIQGELSAAQRYYERLIVASASNAFGVGFADSTTVGLLKNSFKVTKRIPPTALEQTGTATDYQIRFTGGGIVNCSAVPTFSTSTVDEGVASFPVASGLTGGQGISGRAGTTAAYLGWSAEL
jgi:hypothetical protein